MKTCNQNPKRKITKISKIKNEEYLNHIKIEILTRLSVNNRFADRINRC